MWREISRFFNRAGYLVFIVIPIFVRPFLLDNNYYVCQSEDLCNQFQKYWGILSKFEKKEWKMPRYIKYSYRIMCCEFFNWYNKKPVNLSFVEKWNLKFSSMQRCRWTFIDLVYYYFLLKTLFTQKSYILNKSM